MFKSCIITVSTAVPSVDDDEEVDSLLIQFGNSFFNSTSDDAAVFVQLFAPGRMVFHH